MTTTESRPVEKPASGPSMARKVAFDADDGRMAFGAARATARNAGVSHLSGPPRVLQGCGDGCDHAERQDNSAQRGAADMSKSRPNNGPTFTKGKPGPRKRPHDEGPRLDPSKPERFVPQKSREMLQRWIKGLQLGARKWTTGRP